MPNQFGCDPCVGGFAQGFAEPSYCCKYFRGATGPTGPTGPQGATGAIAPIGPVGQPGVQGLPGAIEILRTITGEPGSSAAVLNSGDGPTAQLTFVIPAGLQGLRGATGE